MKVGILWKKIIKDHGEVIGKQDENVASIPSPIDGHVVIPVQKKEPEKITEKIEIEKIKVLPIS